MIHGQIHPGPKVEAVALAVARPAPLAPRLHTAPRDSERRVPVLRLVAIVAAIFAFGAADSIADLLREGLAAGASPIAISTAIGR